jgi:hypothetical protein
MIRRCVALLQLVCVGAIVTAPSAHAIDAVTYEVSSDSIPVASIEYVDQSGRKLLESMPLPWRLDLSLDDAMGPAGRGAQLRADWRPIAGPSQWVTVQIYSNGKLLCQSNLDVGNATCYGNTPHNA